jgi:hypothetical protein
VETVIVKIENVKFHTYQQKTQHTAPEEFENFQQSEGEGRSKLAVCWRRTTMSVVPVTPVSLRCCDVLL